MEQQQQQQDAVVDRSILDPIMRLRQRWDEEHEEPLNRLLIQRAERINRQSVQYLVDFLREDSSHQIKELFLHRFSLLNASDGSLDILIDFFANSDDDSRTRLSKVVLSCCNFGNAEEASRLFTAFHSTNNTTVTDLEISYIRNLQGTALAACLSDLFRNSNLQRIFCGAGHLQDAGIRALQPDLEANRHLKELALSNCAFGDEGVRLLADALVGNTTLEILDVRQNSLLTPLGLPHVTRILESTQLKEIRLGWNGDLFGDEDAVQHFARTLSRNQFLKALNMGVSSMFFFTPGAAVANILQALEHNSSLEQVAFGPTPPPQQQQIIDQIIASLPQIKGLRRLHFLNWDFLLQNDAFVPALQNNTSLEEFLHTNEQDRRVDADDDYYGPQHRARLMAIMSILARNRSLNRAKALLALQPRTGGLPIVSKSGVWYKAMAKLQVGQRRSTSSSPGAAASAIFHILQTRPALLERQLRRPPPPPSQQAASHRLCAAVEQERNDDPHHENDDDNNGDNDDDNNRPLTATSGGDGRKRARLAL